MNLFEALQCERASPGGPALLLDGRGISYGAFFGRCRDLSDRLAAAGVLPGDCVGISIQNPAGHLTTVLALLRLGAVSTAFYPQWPERQFAEVSRRHRVQAFVVDTMHAAHFGGKGVPVFTTDRLFGDRPAGLAEVNTFEPADALPWAYVLSSGTTGMPKTVVRTHGAVLANLELRLPRISSHARVMLPNDMAMVWSLMSAFQALQAGATLVLSSSHHARDLLARIAVDRPTHFISSTDTATKLAWYRHQLRERNEVRAIVPMQVNVTGGALNEKARTVVCSELAHNLVVTYASSEAGVTAVLDDADSRSVSGHAGWLLPGVEVQAISDDGLPLSAGSVGRLRIRSPGGAIGYLDDSGVLQAFRDGWFVSDDLGSVDDQGCLRLLGRASQVLNLGGRKVDPLVIEQAIEKYPTVIEAAVTVVRPESAPFEVLVAVVVASGELTLESLRRHLRDLVPADKIPEFLACVDQLPRNAMGKLMRDDLAQSIRIAQKTPA